MTVTREATALDLEAPCDVVIVGSGFAGTALLLRLRALDLERRLRVTLVERSGDFGPGVAYRASPETYLLNVPAGRLGLHADTPSGFVDYLRGAGRDASAASFVPRAWFGQYLRHELTAATAVRDAHARLLRGEVSDAVPDGPSWRVLAGPVVLRTRAVVLAVGNEPPLDPPGLDPRLVESERYLRDPLGGDAGRLDAIEPGANVMCLGTGLTMTDVVLHLDERVPRVRFLARSRRGLLPRVHATADRAAARLSSADAPSPALRPLARHVIRRLREAGEDWRPLVDDLRPETQGIWSGWSAGDRARFMRHLRPFWEVHRHRLPPWSARRLARLEEEGRLRLERSRSLAPPPATDYLINCTGPNRDPARSSSPLLRRLLARDVIRRDPLGLGFQPHPRLAASLHTLGAVRVGELYESTAVPELRSQADALARRLLVGRG